MSGSLSWRKASLFPKIFLCVAKHTVVKQHGYWQANQHKLVRSPYQTCAEMLSLLRTHTEQLKCTSKRKKSTGKAVRKRMRGAPEPGAPAPATGHSPRILFPTAFPIDFLRFEVHFSCSVWVLRRDSISAHVWYGLRTYLPERKKGFALPFRSASF